jgi:hypothetical protein
VLGRAQPLRSKADPASRTPPYSAVKAFSGRLRVSNSPHGGALRSLRASPAGLSEWIGDLDRLEAVFPRYLGLNRRISHWTRVAV